MQQQTSLHIATPCHEDWNAMTPAQAGKFCAACSKQVVDFTLMSDHQILTFLSQQNGKLCGRFDAGQLARPLVEATLSKKRSWYLALLLPFSLFFEKSSAQTAGKTLGKVAVKVEQTPVLMGDTIMMGTPAMTAQDWVIIHGTLLDETGNAVEGAAIIEKGTSHGTVSDSAGRFAVMLRRNADSIVLVASSVGYHSVEKKVSLADADTAINLVVTTAPALLGDVIVSSLGIVGCRRTMGGISISRRVTRAEKTDSLVKKILRMNRFTAYPNPARSGSQVQVTVKKKGDYELQLLSNGSALLKTEEIIVDSDNATASFQLPPNLAAGIYYLRLTDTNNKTSYLEKLMVN